MYESHETLTKKSNNQCDEHSNKNLCDYGSSSCTACKANKPSHLPVQYGLFVKNSLDEEPTCK